MNRKERHQLRLAEQNRVRRAAEARDNEYMRRATLLMFYISLLYLRDKQGYGKKRLGDFMEGCVDILNSISMELLDFNDIRKVIYDETGVEINFTGADDE